MENQLPDASEVRNIIFDLGGVILHIDYHLTADAFKRLGAATFDDVYSQASQSDLFDRLERGELNSEGFAREVREVFNGDWTDRQIIDAWNAMLLELPMSRIHLLQEMKTRYRLFLLSNTNEIHLEGCRGMFDAALGRRDLSHIFEKEYYSSLIGMRKPDREVFDLIVDSHGLNKEETLFIDDSIQHVVGARHAGLMGYHLEKGQEITEIFSGW